MSVLAILPDFGHNERSVRLGLLADDAKHALKRVERGESEAIEGWLAYGAALNEGRALFPRGDNSRFSEWLANSNLEEGVHPAEQSAAMWAAANPEQFAEARAAGNARTVRGIHAKWKEIQAEREAESEAQERRGESEAKRKEAEAARAREEAARHEAEARARAEDDARRAAEEASAEDERQEAIARAEAAAKARRRAQEEAEAAAHEAREADRQAEAAERQAEDIIEASRKVRGTQGTGDNEWYTPQDLIERARRVLGGFDVDPASSDLAQEKVQARAYFTAETNGLEQDWNGSVWLNPPYSQPLIGQFMDKLREEYGAGRCKAAIVLTHNYTDTRWFQGAAADAAAICFTRGRVKFYSPTGEVAAPTQGQAFFYFGSEVDAFAEEFSEVGFVVEVRRD